MGQNKESFAKLRQLLAKPIEAQETQEIIDLLKTWPDTADREMAIQYASEHLDAQQLPLSAAYFSSKEASKMLFDPENKKLFTNEGLLIKELCCPLSKTWEELQSIVPNDAKRRCHECGKNVLNTKGLQDTQVMAILQYDAEACIYIDEQHENVIFLHPKEERASPNRQRSSRNRPNPLSPEEPVRIIRTARTEKEINRAADQGFRPLVKKVERTGNIGTPMQVVQHKASGRIEIRTDLRRYLYGRDTEYDIIFEHRYDPSEHYPSPFAAYLIPFDLQEGEQVFLEDLIEEFTDFYHQGASRLQSCIATWNGKDFEIQFHPEIDTRRYIG